MRESAICLASCPIKGDAAKAAIIRNRFFFMLSCRFREKEDLVRAKNYAPAVLFLQGKGKKRVNSPSFRRPGRHSAGQIAARQVS